jgi:beta-lactamase regulating signal transducer with metallopeptidase domain
MLTTISISDLAAGAVHASLWLLVLKATVILLAALGITLAMQKASAGARHLVWLVTLGTLLLVPALTAWAPLTLRILPARDAVATPPAADSPAPFAVALSTSTPSRDVAAPSRTDHLRGERTIVVDEPVNSVGASDATGIIRARLAGMSTLSLLFVTWAAVVLVIAASLAWASLAVRRIVRHGQPLDGRDWTGPLYEIADRMGLAEPPRLLRSDEARMPFACGIATPTIVLPSDCESWSLDRRRAVLLHELAHVRRHDLLGHTLGRLVCAVYWFHPLVWTAAKRLRAESERACDDLALACGTRATDYAEHLLDIVTSVRGGDATPSVALAMARRKEFEGRMLAILDPELRRTSPTRRQSSGVIAALALVALTVGAASPAPRNAPNSYASDGAHPDTARRLRADSGHRTHADSSYRVHPDADNRLSTIDPLSRDAVPMNASDARAMEYAQNTRIESRMHERTIERMVRSPIESLVAVVVPNIESAAAVAAGSVESSVAKTLDGILSGSIVAVKPSSKVRVQLGRRAVVGAQQAQSHDDRPVLLAKVLATDSSATLRRIAAWGLNEYADNPVAAEALANALKRDHDAGVREMAAWSLAEGNGNTSVAVDALSSALRGDASERVRMTAAWALGNVGDRGATDALTAALGDASTDVRLRAAWALGNVEPRQAPAALVALLRDRDPHTRKLAAWALFNIEDPSTAPALEAALKGERDTDLQMAYIRALAAMGEKSVDALRGLLESSDPEVKSMAVRALAGGHATGPWPWPWPQPRPRP